MAIPIKRYKDKTYIPLFAPLSRRIDYGTGPKETSRQRVKRQLKEGTYKKTWFDRNIVDNIIP